MLYRRRDIKYCQSSSGYYSSLILFFYWVHIQVLKFVYDYVGISSQVFILQPPCFCHSLDADYLLDYCSVDLVVGV